MADPKTAEGAKETPDETDLLIEDYLEGRMSPSLRRQFEERMAKDEELRSRVLTATQSVEMVEHALGWVTPGDDFDDRVTSKIVDITQSGIRPPVISSSDRNLSSSDPDAKLLADPEAKREQQRLFFLAIAAAVLFALAVIAIIYSIGSGMHKP